MEECYIYMQGNKKVEKFFVLYLTRAEPKDYEINDFILKNYYQLRFSPAVGSDDDL